MTFLSLVAVFTGICVMANLQRPLLGMSVRIFPERSHGGGKVRLEYGWHPSPGWGSRLDNEELGHGRCTPAILARQE